jgi:hypothetical protein
MTPEDLLKPRYKVVADYPDSIFKIGGILIQGEKDLTEAAKYPHLFKKLEWWEEREEKDMPEYLKCIKTPDQLHFSDEIFKVEWNGVIWAKSERGLCVVSTNCYIPVTAAEYLQYKNKTV